MIQAKKNKDRNLLLRVTLKVDSKEKVYIDANFLQDSLALVIKYKSDCKPNVQSLMFIRWSLKYV